MPENKYLEKIAEESKSEVQPAKLIGGLVGVAGGSALTRESYLNGELTGRKTLYHGTTEAYADRIKKVGLQPRSKHGKAGIIDILEEGYKGWLESDDLTFTTKNKSDARVYAHQANHVRDTGRRFQGEAEMIGKIKKSKALDRGVVELSVPTWKPGLSNKGNPELDKYKQGIGWEMSSRSERRALQKTLGDSVHTTSDTIRPKFIKGSPQYSKNSASEILAYIKAKPGRFAKALAKLAPVVGGGLLLANSTGKETSDNES